MVIRKDYTIFIKDYVFSVKIFRKSKRIFHEKLYFGIIKQDYVSFF
jgi:hypothetical protein